MPKHDKKRAASPAPERGGGGKKGGDGGGGPHKKQKVSGGKASSHQPRSLVEALSKGGKKVDPKKPKKAAGDGKKKALPVGGDGKGKGNGKGKAAPVDHKTLKPNYTLVEGLKSIWNTVRIKATPADVRSKLVQQMAAKMEGHIMQVRVHSPAWEPVHRVHSPPLPAPPLPGDAAPRRLAHRGKHPAVWDRKAAREDPDGGREQAV